MGRKAKLLSGTHRRPARDSHSAEVIRAGDIFEPTDREAVQNADRIEWIVEEPEQPDSDEGVDATEERVEEPESEPEPWTLKMSPEEYLEKHPGGPNAALARQHLEE